MSVCIVVVTREHLSLRTEHGEHAPLGVVGKLEAHAPVRLGIVASERSRATGSFPRPRPSGYRTRWDRSAVPLYSKTRCAKASF